MNNKHKGEIMNKLTKVGVSALAGSLAMVSANAVEYALTGDAMIKMVSAQGNEAGAAASNGRGIGVDNDFYINASGELDNGWTVSAYSAWNLEGSSNSSSQLTIGLGSAGSISFNDVWGVPSWKDDMSASIHAYEEPWDSTTHGRIVDSFGLDTQSGSVSYVSPSFDLGGIALSGTASYDPNSGSAASTPGTADSTTSNPGKTFTIEASYAGFTLGAGEETSKPAVSGVMTDEVNTIGYAIYKNGPFSIMYQELYKDETHGAGTEGADYKADTWGVGFAQGDWAVSYVEQNESKSAVSNTAAGKDVEMTAFGVSYTMGAMSIKGGVFETTNPEFTTGKYEETEIAISFAF